MVFQNIDFEYYKNKMRNIENYGIWNFPLNIKKKEKQPKYSKFWNM